MHICIINETNSGDIMRKSIDRSSVVSWMHTLGNTTAGDLHSNKLIDRTKLKWLSPVSFNLGSRLYANC